MAGHDNKLLRELYEQGREGWQRLDESVPRGAWVRQVTALSGVDAPWVEKEEEEEDVWDEATAARAEEEMRLASAARRS